MSISPLNPLTPLAWCPIVETPVAVTSYPDAIRRIVSWAAGRESRTIIAANVHVVMEAHHDPAFREVVTRADLVTPDGVPLVWALRLMGERSATRVYGPDLMRHLCAHAAQAGMPIALFGSTPEVLNVLQNSLTRDYPGIRIAYAFSPPFRAFTEDEERDVVSMINESGARLLFVGLGCPKQERWVDRQRGAITMPMLAVGAAFDFIAGTKSQAPPVVQRAGLEWLFRLMQEPRRLWRRYLYYNPRFVALLLRQLISKRATPWRTA